MSARTIAIVDYKIGNKHSITSALNHVAGSKDTVALTDNNASIKNCSHLVFPGVGAIGDCKNALLERGLLDVVLHHIKSGKPLFAICVGMQLLFQYSEENESVAGVGLFDKSMQKLAANPAQGIKVPHIGWNTVIQSAHPVWCNIPDRTPFYFVHSFAALEQEPAATTIGTTQHGNNQFAAAVAHENVVATQFHPEKSHSYGLQLLRNFLNES